jgi:hypothetical protein
VVAANTGWEGLGGSFTTVPAIVARGMNRLGSADTTAAIRGHAWSTPLQNALFPGSHNRCSKVRAASR